MPKRDQNFDDEEVFAERKARRRDPNYDPRFDDPDYPFAEDEIMDPVVAESVVQPPELPQVPDGARTPSRPSGAPNLAAALAAAQGEIKNPAKSAENPHFKSKYANLVEGLIAIKGPLAAHGIAVVQSTRMQDDLLILTTRLIHDSGEFVESEWPVADFRKLNPQQMGSALTYARRYSLFSIVGISGADDDDDGEAVTTAAADDPAIDVDDVAYVETLIRDTGSDLAQFLKYVGAPSVAKMRMSQFKKGVGRLADKKRKMQAEAKPE